MPEVVVQGVRFSYETAGDGFPLVLTPGPQGQREVWTQYLPLLGELCRTIAYACHEEDDGLQHRGLDTSERAADALTMFLDVTGLERVYLASLSAGWSMALHFALRYPARLEGLVLIAAHSAAMDARPEVLALEARLPEITAPTLVLIEERVRAALPSVDVLKERLPRCTQVVMPESSLSPSAHTPTLQLGHTIMHFLLHCERQRNLVRGASFLL